MNSVKLTDSPFVFSNGSLVPDDGTGSREKTMAYKILAAHDTSDEKGKMKLRFDGMASHDITYVNIIQTVRSANIDRFPLPYVLTCCHNSLCAVGGTINADDHAFGLSAARRYGAAFVPPHLAVIHQYMREMMAGCGKMLLGSDSHTRYGALGTVSIGEGGPELAKQLVGKTYDIDAPSVVAVRLTGSPAPGVGPQDAALALVGATFANGFVKNKIMEFVGPGISGLRMDYRLGIDVMTTETTCLSSIWETDETVREYLALHGRECDYKKLSPDDGARYDGLIELDLSALRPMIALPFHPSNAVEIAELNANLGDMLRCVEQNADRLGMKGLKLTDKIENGRLRMDQGVIAGCAGGLYDNLVAAAGILERGCVGSGGFILNAYPASQPIYLALSRDGTAAELLAEGVTIKTAFCGPCFGAGDVPRNGGLSMRHTTRNFENREGSKPGDRQCAAVMLADARSIAATASNGGYLTSATDVCEREAVKPYFFDGEIYAKRVYNGIGKPDPEAKLEFGPNITDWPQIPALPDNLLLKLCCCITDPVTTTDELIPSGETSSYRSNPLRLAQYALSRKDPQYVPRAKAAAGEDPAAVLAAYGLSASGSLLIGSCVSAVKPGDGSAREQAASCQRVLGGSANIASAYATKRYRSNVINWGMLPLRVKNPDDLAKLKVGAHVLIKDVKSILAGGGSDMTALLLSDGKAEELALTVDSLTPYERQIILAGSFINYCAE